MRDMREEIDVNIIVLVKQVPDPREYVRIREDGTLDREKTRSVINPCDRCAIEAAILIKGKYGAKVTAISMGPLKAEDALREALAIGIDEAILISDRRLRGSDTLATAYVLHRAIVKIGHCDLILCGAETMDGGTAQVGPEVAEYIGIPQITYVEEFDIEGNFLEARRAVEGGFERLRTRLPALLTITSRTYKPRNTDFSGILKAMRMSVVTWSLDDLEVDVSKVGLAGSPTKIMKIERSVNKKNNRLIGGKTADEAVDALLNEIFEDGIKFGDRCGKGE